MLCLGLEEMRPRRKKELTGLSQTQTGDTIQEHTNHRIYCEKFSFVLLLISIHGLIHTIL